ncbi:hypothetical protein [Adhaeribacter radiodurans]|uniref:Uncharacterized protein n=1 Tax=Adhaeribacter radiodurans TaxID=2745197 RepID=A0A7L7L9R6_9BACT|nr:hypothetical protein [Adhaeribacter radiodurans]QMU29592.1 hypothetical protein HUW48_16820 [Adhaeribacter radiodurans]
MSKATWFLLFTFWIFQSYIAYSQEPVQPNRVEFEATTSDSHFEVYPLQDSTLFVYAHDYSDLSTKETFTFSKFDQELNKIWSGQIPIQEDYRLQHIFADHNFIYILFLTYKPWEFVLLRINSFNAAYSEVTYDLRDYDLPADLRIESFKVLNNNAYLIAYDLRHLIVLNLDLQTDQIKTIPALYDKADALATFNADTATQRAEFVLSESNGRIGRLQVKRFDEIGNLRSIKILQSKLNRSLITSQLSPGDSSQKIMVGTYSLRDMRYAQGLFTSQLFNEQSDIIYYDFKSFRHFFDYMRKGRRERLYRKAARFKAKDKDFRLRYRILLHDIIYYEKGMLLVAEAYYPQYSSSSTYNYGLAPLARVFDGYRYTHTIACAFDKEGKLIWDNSFTLRDALQENLIENTQLIRTGDKIIMAYSDEKNIRYKIIQQDSVTKDNSKVAVLANEPNEKVTEAERTGLLSWYNNVFIAYGYQRVRPPGGPARNVFYLNKVVFE